MAKKGHEDAHASGGVLIDGRHHDPFVANGAKDFHPGGGLPNDGIAAEATLGNDEIIHKRIAQPPMDNMHREAVTGVGMGQEFPVAEMSVRISAPVCRYFSTRPCHWAWSVKRTRSAILSGVRVWRWQNSAIKRPRFSQLSRRIRLRSAGFLSGKARARLVSPTRRWDRSSQYSSRPIVSPRRKARGNGSV